MVAAGTAAAQAPGTNPESPAKLAPSPVEALKETVAEIRNLKVPIETEPAFAFRAQ